MFRIQVPERFKNETDVYIVRQGLHSLAIQRGIRFGVLALLFLALGGMWGCPVYNVWQKGLSGQARLREAEQSRQIAVEEAKALKESAQFKADAEVTRAEGVSKANAIISEGLGGPEGYLRYLWIDAISQGTGPQIIYVPTETGLPILEAGKR